MNARQRRAVRRNCHHNNRVECFGFPDAGYRPMPRDVTVGGNTVPKGTIVHMTGEWSCSMNRMTAELTSTREQLMDTRHGT